MHYFFPPKHSSRAFATFKNNEHALAAGGPLGTCFCIPPVSYSLSDWKVNGQDVTARKNVWLPSKVSFSCSFEGEALNLNPYFNTNASGWTGMVSATWHSSGKGMPGCAKFTGLSVKSTEVPGASLKKGESYRVTVETAADEDDSVFSVSLAGVPHSCGMTVENVSGRTFEFVYNNPKETASSTLQITRQWGDSINVSMSKKSRSHSHSHSHKKNLFHRMHSGLAVELFVLAKKPG